MPRVRLESFDIMGIIAPIVGYIVLGWPGAILAVVIRSEIKFKF